MLTDVHYTPELVKNLVSTAHIVKLGCSIHIDTTRCHVMDSHEQPIQQGMARGNMLVLLLDLSPPEHVCVAHDSLSLNALHCCFGHMCEH
jgi:hypothetical protein